MLTTTTKKRLDSEFRALIARAIAEVLTDPDFGLELSEEAKKRLRRALTSRTKTISFSEIKKRYA